MVNDIYILFYKLGRFEVKYQTPYTEQEAK